MYDEVKDDPTDGPHHLELLEVAKDALKKAEQRMAEDEEDETREELDDETDESEEDEDDIEGGQDEEGEPAAEKGDRNDIEMIPESDLEKDESSAPSSSLPAAPSSSLVMGSKLSVSSPAYKLTEKQLPQPYLLSQPNQAKSSIPPLRRKRR